MLRAVSLGNVILIEVYLLSEFFVILEFYESDSESVPLSQLRFRKHVTKLMKERI